MERNRGIGSIAIMVVAIATMTVVRTFRWNELGLLDRIMIVVIWIAVAGGATAIGVTLWRYASLRVQLKRAGSPDRAEQGRSI
ncbi:MAG: hypothetical protein WAK03_00795 [Methylocystis sp.]|jgi:hypothetical protein